MNEFIIANLISLLVSIVRSSNGEWKIQNKTRFNTRIFIGKELENDDQHIAVKLILFFIITKVFTRSVRVKYVVYSPTKVVLNLTELLSSTVRRSLTFHYITAKKFFEELHRAEN